MALGHYSPSDAIELRCVLESWAFAQAAERRPATVLRQLEVILKDMIKPDIGLEEFNALDFAFHSNVIESCGNEIATTVARGLQTVIRRSMLQDVARGSDWPSEAERLAREHQLLYGLVCDGDAVGAGEFVERHIRSWAPTPTRGAERETRTPDSATEEPLVPARIDDILSAMGAKAVRPPYRLPDNE
jgi:DNA-binding FadR family transcriptional regulator